MKEAGGGDREIAFYLVSRHLGRYLRNQFLLMSHVRCHSMEEVFFHDVTLRVFEQQNQGARNRNLFSSPHPTLRPPPAELLSAVTEREAYVKFT